jgi:(E)-4-hydroxy-3-methyl-but-2-enyl pyrophosphate reductase
MRVIVAKTGGFCKGVRDALDVTLQSIQDRKEGEEICTYGPLIHNRQVLASLEEKGIRSEERIERCSNKKVVIRAHGIPPNERQTLHQIGATLLDATCKRVARVHAVIKQHARNGYHIIITGDADHAEVIGLMGYAGGRGHVVNRPEQIDSLPEEWEKVLLVTQTTQNEELFRKIQGQFLKRYPRGVVKNTICGSTHERQAEVRQQCKQVEAMVVVGGYHSGNTVRLAEVARESGVPTYHIETEADLNRQDMARYAVVGVSAGASTPSWIIRSVVQFLESIQPEPGDWRYKMKRAQEILSYGNADAALGAALLGCAVQALAGLPWGLASSLMPALFVFSMHSLNSYVHRGALQWNDPGRAAFYHRWWVFFTILSGVAVFLSLLLAWQIGAMTFLALVVMLGLGLVYSFPDVFPQGVQRWQIFRITTVPNYKTLFVPLAWALVIAVLPYLSQSVEKFGKLIFAAWVVFGLVFTRTALIDLLAIRGDRLVGKETLVVQIGESSTIRVLRIVLTMLACSLVLGPLLRLSSWFAIILLGAVGVYYWTLALPDEGRWKEDPLFELMVESVLMGSGALGLLWQVF